VTACTAAGVGGAVRLTIGGTSHPEVGPPLEAAGEVLRLDAGVFRADAPVHAGLDVSDAGPTALARLDTGQLVVLTTRAVMPVSATQVTRLGVDLAELDVVLAKGVHSPLAGYAGHVADHVFVDTPGVTAVDLNRLPYRNRRAPMLPFEDDAVLRIGLP
jgi:microcystin degradation protein MlrC